MMKRAGRVSPLLILGGAGLLGMVGVLLFTRGGTSPAQRVHEFFAALDRSDVDAIIATSTLGDLPEAEQRAKWQQTTERAKHYIFVMQIKETSFATADEATVAVEMYQNAANPDVASKRFQVPVIRVDGEWKVDARSLSRAIYPALPR